MMVHGGETGGEDTSDVFDILEGKGGLGELSVGYLGVDHLVHGSSNRGLGEVIETA